MRDIKYRAFDKEHKAMYVVMTAIYFDGTPHACDFLGYCGDEKTVEIEHLELMQYTERQDKNKKDIYEGDVLARQSYTHWVVCWHNTGFHIYNVTNPDTMFPLPMDTNDREIIGNIWENPELLEY